MLYRIVARLRGITFDEALEVLGKFKVKKMVARRGEIEIEVWSEDIKSVINFIKKLKEDSGGYLKEFRVEDITGEEMLY